MTAAPVAAGKAAGQRVACKLIVEADGGSRGNPGPAGYGAVVRDAASGDVLAELSESLGTTTNNVAEYAGLIAGLETAGDLAPGADVDVRMDSKLVVEQMSGRWQVKHPALQPLASRASAAARRLGRVTYEWVPRARNTDADRLANQAMDEARTREGKPGGPGAGPDRRRERPDPDPVRAAPGAAPRLGGRPRRTVSRPRPSCSGMVRPPSRPSAGSPGAGTSRSPRPAGSRPRRRPSGSRPAAAST